MIATRVRRATRVVSRFATLLLLLLTAAGIGYAQTADEAVERYQQEQIEAIAQAFDADQLDLNSKLAHLGYKDLNGFSAENVSAEALLRHAARRAEAGKPGDGKRLIAALWRQAEKDSAIATTASEFASLNAYTPQVLAEKFVFSSSLEQTEKIQLPEPVERALTALAAHRWPHASVSAVLLRSLQKTGFNSGSLDAIAKEAPSLVEYLRRAIAAGTPPPLPAEAVLRIIAEVQAASAIALTNPALNAIKVELARPLPEAYALILARESRTPTARAEIAAMRTGARSAEIPISSFRGWNGDGPPSPTSPGVTPPSGGPPPFSGAIAIDISGSGLTPSRHATLSRDAYQRWDNGTFGAGRVLRPGVGTTLRAPFFGQGGLSRSFEIASRNIRGPGGISLGAVRKDDINDRPIAARWLPRPSAPQLGYFLVTMQTTTGKTYTALSRLLFAEGADAAQRAIIGVGADRLLAFKEGDILPVVSMDRESNSGDEKGVVVNPALAGLKLAWSAVRSDFQFISFEGALNDAAVLRPGLEAREARTDAALATSKAITWQIRERPHVLKLMPDNGAMRIISCIDGLPCSWDAYPAGYEFALFVESPALAHCHGDPRCTPQAVVAGIATQIALLRDELARLGGSVSPQRQAILEAGESLLAQRQSLLAQLQRRPGESNESWAKRLTDSPPREPGKDPAADAGTRYLSWLVLNHPDFIRINDLHHAMAVARWLSHHGLAVPSPGRLFAPRPYPVPNRIRFGSGGSPEAFVGVEIR